MTASTEILSDGDIEKILAAVVRQAGPGGVTEEDLFRRTEQLAEHIRRLKVDHALYEGFRKGMFNVALTENGDDTVWTNSAGTT